MTIFFKENFILNFLKNKSVILIYLLPFFLISGPFLPDFFVTIFSITFLLFFLFFKKKIHYNKFFLYLLLIFFLYLNINVIINYNFEIKALEHSIPFLRFVFFVIFLGYIIKSQLNITSTYKYILFAILFVSIDIIIQFFIGYDIFGHKAYEYSAEGNRLSGVFGSELKAGGFIARLLPFAISFLIFKKTRFELVIFFILVCFIATILTGERTGFILFSLGTILSFLFYYRIKFTLIFGLFFSIVLIFIISTNQKIAYRYLHQYDFINFESFLNTPWGAHYWTATKMFKENKIIGIGVNKFRIDCSKQIYATTSRSDNARCSTHPHNTYFQIISELGIIGSIIFIAILSYLILYFIKLKNSLNNENRILLIGAFISFFVQIFPFVPTGNFFNNWNSIIFWFPISLMLLFINLNLYGKN